MYISKLMSFCKLPTDEKLIALGYVIAHGGVLLLLPAIYWDDWVLYNHEASDILSRFEMAGTPFGLYAYIHAYMQIPGPLGYKLLSFFLYLGSVLFFYKILLRQEWISQKNCYLIALLFAVLPFNFARIMEISLPYSLSNFLFFAGWYWLLKNKVIAIPLFFLAFFIPSFLMFYLLPILELLKRDLFVSGVYWKPDSFKKISVWILRNSVVVALPIVYYSLKIKYFSPSGLYAGYNEGFGIEKVWPALEIIYSDLLGQDVSLPLLIIGVFLAFIFLSRFKELMPDRQLLAVGVFAIGLAVFPYLILGLTPVFDEWTTSRHQLLLPLGVACLVTGVAGYMITALARYFLCLILAISFAMNFNFYYMAYLDWAKQTAVLNFLRDSDFKQADVILLDDRTESKFKRTVGFYEWSGIVKLAYGDQKRFAMRIEEYPNYLSGAYDKYFLSMYNAGAHIRLDTNAVRVLVVDYVKLVGAPPLTFGRQRYSIRLAPISRH